MAELLKEEISAYVREKVSEEWGMITVTKVLPSEDLKSARVYLSCLEKEKTTEVLAVLGREIPALQRFLGRKLQLRHTPKISFTPDESLAEINRVEELLQRIKNGSSNLSL